MTRQNLRGEGERYQLTLSGQPPPLGEVAVSSLSPGTPLLLWDPSHSPVLQS